MLPLLITKLVGWAVSVFYDLEVPDRTSSKAVMGGLIISSSGEADVPTAATNEVSERIPFRPSTSTSIQDEHRDQHG